MRVLVSVDIEGVAGVFHPEQTRSGNPEYEIARQYMTAEANAAVRGAFAAGANEVLVNDSHGTFRNILPDAIDDRAKLILSKPRVLGMMSGLELAPDCVLMVGYHAKAQSRGMLAHTINSFAFARVWLNELELGEAGLYGALANSFGVPIAFASGDDVFVEETKIIFPNATYVITKQALGANTGVSCSPHAACNLIEFNVEQSIKSKEHALDLIYKDVLRCRIQVTNPVLADLFCILPNIERIDAVSIFFESSSVEFVIRTLNSLSTMSTALRV
jgi:D-amino peptidase